MIPILKFDDKNFDQAFATILARAEQTPEGVEETVREIIAAVRQDGDEAVFAYTSRFDRLDLTSETVQVSQDEIDQAMQVVEPEALAALELAAERIAAFHRRQLE